MLIDQGFFQRTFPSAVIALVIAATAVPWGLPDAAVFVLPLTAMMLTFLFSCLRTSELQPWSVFACGLGADLLTAGPFGFWAFIFLLAYSFGRGARPYAPGLGAVGMWLAFAFIAALISTIAWVLASLYFMQLLDPYPMTVGLIAIIAIFPATFWLMQRLTGARPGGAFSFRN